MLVEPVGHPLQAEAHVLQADLLADDVERQGAEAPVHLAHDAGEHGAVSHAGVEHAERRRLGMDVGELQPGAFGDHPFLRAGVDEGEVFLAVVVEPEGGPGAAVSGVRRRRFGLPGRPRRGRNRFGDPDGGSSAVLVQEPTHPVDGGGGHALALANPADELAVVDDDPPERGLGDACLSAIGFDLVDQTAQNVHPRASRSVPSDFGIAASRPCQTVFPIELHITKDGKYPIFGRNLREIG